MFWICAADANGNRIVGAEEQLFPGPGELEYPTDPAGVVLDTPDGNVVKQQPSKDPRKRAWVWPLIPMYVPRFRRLVPKLEGLVSTTRRAQGLSPYVYIRDQATNSFRKWEFVEGSVTTAGANTLSDSTKNWTVDRYIDASLEIVSGSGAGQRRTVVGNTANTLTLDADWTATPTAGATYRLQGSVSDWVRVRVLEVSKRPGGRAGLSYAPVRMVFVVAEDSWNDLG